MQNKTLNNIKLIRVIRKIRGQKRNYWRFPGVNIRLLGVISSKATQLNCTDISGFRIRHFDYSSDGRYIISIFSEINTKPFHINIVRRHKIIIWDIKTSKMALSPIDISCSILKAIIDNDGNLIIAEVHGSVIKVWNGSTKTMLNQLIEHRGINDITLDPSGKYLASASYDYFIRIWEIRSCNHSVIDTRTKGLSHDLVFSSDMKYLISLSDTFPNRGIEVWSLSQKNKVSYLRGFNRRFTGASYTSQGEKEIAERFKSAIDSTINGNPDFGWRYSWEEEEQVIKEYDSGHFFYPSMSDDGEKVVSLAEDHLIRVWERKTGKIQIMIDDPNIVHARISPDGRYVIATSKHSIYIHDSMSGILIKKFEDNSMHFIHSIFSADNTLIATSTKEGTICVWKFPPLQLLIDEMRERYKNNQLTKEERRRFCLD